MSGSQVPAEAGALHGMMAGMPTSVAAVRELLTPLCREAIDCGAVPNATLTKLTSNIVLLSTVTSLAEAVQTAAASACRETHCCASS